MDRMNKYLENKFQGKYTPKAVHNFLQVVLGTVKSSTYEKHSDDSREHNDYSANSPIFSEQETGTREDPSAPDSIGDEDTNQSKRTRSQSSCLPKLAEATVFTWAKKNRLYKPFVIKYYDN